MSEPYLVLEAESLRELEDRVCGAVDEGYRPIGGVTILRVEWENERKHYTESSTGYYQAVFKGGSQ